uniref:Uncharacterized protein n=1 Tax=Parascaris univalens TaxID=6257 RepID=A0A914ZXW1_PARUN
MLLKRLKSLADSENMRMFFIGASKKADVMDATMGLTDAK